jgi:hypothetical protein
MTAPFGDDKSPQEVTYQAIAEQVRAMTPRALTPHALDDVITLVEFMRDEAIKAHDANVIRSAELDARELGLAKRARDLKLHERAVAAILKPNAPRRLANLWR